jgi:1-acyl-sn-glycerol-3-phosphate acyltransferase
MRRYSRKLLEKKPHLKGKDIETTRQACAKFRHIPVSVMNFVEGTRFTARKHDKQGHPIATCCTRGLAASPSPWRPWVINCTSWWM